MISLFMRQKPELFIQGSDAPALKQGLALKYILRHGIGDTVVEAPVESPEFVDLDFHLTLSRQIRYGLAKIAVVMDDLRDREAQGQLSR